LQITDTSANAVESEARWQLIITGVMNITCLIGIVCNITVAFVGADASPLRVGFAAKILLGIIDMVDIAMIMIICTPSSTSRWEPSPGSSYLQAFVGRF
jgi:hypothetical protein